MVSTTPIENTEITFGQRGCLKSIDAGWVSKYERSCFFHLQIQRTKPTRHVSGMHKGIDSVHTVALLERDDRKAAL